MLSSQGLFGPQPEKLVFRIAPEKFVLRRGDSVTVTFAACDHLFVSVDGCEPRRVRRPQNGRATLVATSEFAQVVEVWAPSSS
jgi:hypothetical protein